MGHRRTLLRAALDIFDKKARRKTKPKGAWARRIMWRTLGPGYAPDGKWVAYGYERSYHATKGIRLTREPT